eukprot:scaffold271239_cov38-Prasinocladus_malaysianus.AAC.1
MMHFVGCSNRINLLFCLKLSLSKCWLVFYKAGEQLHNVAAVAAKYTSDSLSYDLPKKRSYSRFIEFCPFHLLIPQAVLIESM